MFIEDKKTDVPDISARIKKTPVTTIVEEMDCFAPRRFITINYSGPNVREIARKASRILRRGMMITGTNTFIDDYYVDVTDPNNILRLLLDGIERLCSRETQYTTFSCGFTDTSIMMNRGESI